jgi:hypothetical protein
MGGLSQILLGLGGNALAAVIGKKYGAEMGDLAKSALEALGQAFGVEAEPDKIQRRIEEVQAESPQKAAGAVAYAEKDFAPMLLAQAEVLKAANEQQRMTNELLEAQVKQGGLAGAWLWIWQYFLMGVWAWALLVVHILNATIRVFGGAAAAALPAPDLTILMTLTGAYLALHMGGHTVLELMRGGAFGKGGDKA